MTLDADAMIEHARGHYRTLNGREPDSADLIRTLGFLCAYLAQHVSPGFIGWPPAVPARPAKPQRPAILDGEPETATE